MKISVFGSARPQFGEPQYYQAYRLGQLLGESGHTLITGGYMGSMEAVSRGAAEVGAHVIGVTCEEIEIWRPNRANCWVKEEWRAATLLQRIDLMFRNCDAAIALPGGIGTLTEIMVTWNHLVIQAIQDIPLVLVGNTWRNVMEAFSLQAGAITTNNWQRVQFVGSVEEGARLVNTWNSSSDQSPAAS